MLSETRMTRAAAYLRKHEALPIASLYLRGLFIHRGYLPRELNISHRLRQREAKCSGTSFGISRQNISAPSEQVTTRGKSAEDTRVI